MSSKHNRQVGVRRQWPLFSSHTDNTMLYPFLFCSFDQLAWIVVIAERGFMDASHASNVGELFQLLDSHGHTRGQLLNMDHGPIQEKHIFEGPDPEWKARRFIRKWWIDNN